MMIRQPRSPWKTRYFLDTEFTDFAACQLISVAIVGEDGREFYGECSDFERPLCSDFVRGVVLPQLGQFPGRSMPLARLRDELGEWLIALPLKPRPVLCYDFHGDFELVSRLLGGSLPHGWRHENVAQKLDAARLVECTSQCTAGSIMRCTMHVQTPSLFANHAAWTAGGGRMSKMAG